MTNSARTLEDYFTTKQNKRMSLCSNFNTSLKASWSISLQYVRRIHRVCTQCITEKILKSQYFQGYLNTCWPDISSMKFYRVGCPEESGSQLFAMLQWTKKMGSGHQFFFSFFFFVFFGLKLIESK